jgi:hypothetical protein
MTAWICGIWASSRLAQAQVGFAQFLNFTLQVFNAGVLVSADATAHACINFVLKNPVVEGVRHTTESEHHESY